MIFLFIINFAATKFCLVISGLTETRVITDVIFYTEQGRNCHQFLHQDSNLCLKYTL